jgi:hypothetical protein
MNDNPKPTATQSSNFWMVIVMLEANGDFEEVLEGVNSALDTREYGGATRTDVLEIKVRLLMERLGRNAKAFEIVRQHLDVPKFADLARTPEYTAWLKDNQGF